MEHIINTYNTSKSDDVELEIRFKHTSQTDLLKYIRSITSNDTEYELTSFIDSVDYDKETKKGIRTFFDNGKKTNSVYYKKETLNRLADSGPMGKYSIDISSEIDIPKDKVSKKPKIILFKHRISTNVKDEDWRLDLSLVHKSDTSLQALKKSKDSFLKIKTITDILNVLESSEPYLYEYSIEIEYIGNKPITRNDILSAFKVPTLILEGGISNNSSLNFTSELQNISKLLEPKDKFLQYKKTLSNTLKQLLPNPVSLTLQSYGNMYPPVDYMLTDKADGFRAIVYIHNQRAFIFHGTTKSIELETDGYQSTILVDCEYIPDKNLCLLFDVMAIGDTNYCATGEGIEERVKSLEKAEQLLNKHIKNSEINFKAKTYVSLSSPERYKQNFTSMYKHDKYNLDGLILVKKGQPYGTTEALKWKPIENQTIDFYTRKCPETMYGDYYLKRKGYDLYFLYIGINAQLKANMRLTNHPGFDNIFKSSEIQPTKTMPIQFMTPITPLSYMYYYKEGGDDIHNKIIEMKCRNECVKYDENRTLIDWELVKIRHDKIMIPGKDYGNYYITGYNTFLNYLEPFPIESLYNKGTLSESLYFVTKKGNIYSTQTSVTNYVKSVLISEYAHKAKTVLDLGSGRGADINKYIQNNVDTLVVTDNSKPALTELLKRWLGIAKSYHTQIQTSLSAVAIDFNDKAEDNIEKMKGITGHISFNIVFAHLSAHYAAVSTKSIRNFATFCSKVTEKGSKICFTLPMGDKIFDILKGVDEWNAIQDSYLKYSIKKKYIDDTLTDAGQMVDFKLPFSQEKYYEEPLVNIDAWNLIFEDEQMKFIKRTSVLDYMEGFKATNEKKYNELTDDDKTFLGLYGVVVYERM